MMFLDTFHTSVDLGTTNLLIGIKGEGIVFNEPFVLAIERDSGRIAAIGKEAELVAEKTPKSMTVTSPMRRGVIADYSLAEAFLKQSFRKCVRGRALRRPSVAVGIPTSAKDIDRQALYQVLENAGAGTITCCHESIAAAVGLGLPIWEPRGVALCDVGGGRRNYFWKKLEKGFRPYQMTFLFNPGWRNDFLDVGFRHYCMHPVVPFLGLTGPPPQNWECAYDELFIRIHGRLTLIKGKERI